MAFAINEATTALWKATLKDETGAIVRGSQLESLVLTLYEKTTGAILNGRESQDVLNMNNVAVSELGIISWELVPADSLIVTTKRIERHIAVFVAIWADGARSVVHQTEFDVTNISRIPA